MKSEIEPGEVVDLPPPKPECPYWSDGRHCYSEAVGGDIIAMLSLSVEVDGKIVGIKACRCGSRVKPR